MSLRCPKCKKIKFNAISCPRCGFIERRESDLIDLQHANNKYYENKQQEKIYVKFVADHYRNQGYTSVEYRQIPLSQEHEIDIILKKGREIVFIQCKNWEEEGKWQITHAHIRRLRAEGNSFVEANPVFKIYEPKVRFVLSGDFIGESALAEIEKAQACGENVDYEIVRMA